MKISSLMTKVSSIFLVLTFLSSQGYAQAFNSSSDKLEILSNVVFWPDSKRIPLAFILSS